MHMYFFELLTSNENISNIKTDSIYIGMTISDCYTDTNTNRFIFIFLSIIFFLLLFLAPRYSLLSCGTCEPAPLQHYNWISIFFSAESMYPSLARFKERILDRVECNIWLPGTIWIFAYVERLFEDITMKMSTSEGIENIIDTRLTRIIRLQFWISRRNENKE